MVSCQESDRERRCVLEFSRRCGRRESSRAHRALCSTNCITLVSFLSQGMLGSHRVFLFLFWKFSSVIGVVYTTLYVLLQVQLQCAVDTMQDIGWQAPVAGFQWCHSIFNASFLNLNCLAPYLLVWNSAQILDELGRTHESFNYLL